MSYINDLSDYVVVKERIGKYLEELGIYCNENTLDHIVEEFFIDVEELMTRGVKMNNELYSSLLERTILKLINTKKENTKVYYSAVLRTEDNKYDYLDDENPDISFGLRR